MLKVGHKSVGMVEPTGASIPWDETAKRGWEWWRLRARRGGSLGTVVSAVIKLSAAGFSHSLTLLLLSPGWAGLGWLVSVVRVYSLLVVCCGGGADV